MVDLIAKALAEVPQPYLIEVMQTQRPCDAVYQDRVRYRSRDDVAKVELDEVDGGSDRVVRVLGVYIADLDEDEENQGDEEEKGGQQGEGTAGEGCPLNDCVSGNGVKCRGSPCHDEWRPRLEMVWSEKQRISEVEL